jgi:tetratricopeptide (TPR) repeat protein
MLKNYAEALQDSEKSIGLSNNWAKGHYWKGVTLKEIGKYGDAKEALELAYMNDYHDNEACNQLLEVKQLLGDTSPLPPRPKIEDRKMRKRKAREAFLEREGPQSRDMLSGANILLIKDGDEEETQKNKKAKKQPTNSIEKYFHRKQRMIDARRLSVDIESGLAKNGKIYTEDNDIFNVDLIKTDISCRLSIIRVPFKVDPTKSKYYMWFTVRWLIENYRAPQTSLTELTIDEAKIAFKRMFRDRTGIEWDSRFNRTEWITGMCNWRYCT